MRFGHFDDARREYVIYTPRTPLPWINYLGSEDFFSLVSNTGGGYSFYRDARLRRLTRYRYNNSPLDMDGHRIYINDGGTIWNPGWQPAKTELDRYTCRHGLGYTILQGEKNGIAAAQELFVPRGDACEIDRLTLENKTAAPSTLDVFSYVEFCLWDAMDDSSNFQRNFSTGEVEVVGSAIYHKTEYRERRVLGQRPCYQLRHQPGCLLRLVRRPRRTGSGQSRSLLEQHCPRLGSGGCPPFPSHAGTGREKEHHLRAGLH